MTRHSYKLTELTIEEIIKEEEQNIPNINVRAYETIGVSKNTWYARKKTGDFTVAQILKLAEFLNMHDSKIFNACVNAHAQVKNHPQSQGGSKIHS